MKNHYFFSLLFFMSFFQALPAQSALTEHTLALDEPENTPKASYFCSAPTT